MYGHSRVSKYVKARDGHTTTDASHWPRGAFYCVSRGAFYGVHRWAFYCVYRGAFYCVYRGGATWTVELYEAQTPSRSMYTASGWQLQTTTAHFKDTKIQWMPMTTLGSKTETSGSTKTETICEVRYEWHLVFMIYSNNVSNTVTVLQSVLGQLAKNPAYFLFCLLHSITCTGEKLAPVGWRSNASGSTTYPRIKTNGATLPQHTPESTPKLYHSLQTQSAVNSNRL